MFSTLALLRSRPSAWALGRTHSPEEWWVGGRRRMLGGGGGVCVGGGGGGRWVGGSRGGEGAWVEEEVMFGAVRRGGEAGWWPRRAESEV